jgi:hypothetical protein
MKYSLLPIMMIFVFLTGLSMEADAQTKRKRPAKKPEKKEKVKEPENEVNFFRDQLSYDIKIGNIGFFNGFSISTKLYTGYKLGDRFSAGIGGKMFYDQFIVRGAPDISFFDRGLFGFARGKVTNEIFIQAEYISMRYDRFETTVNYPLIGAGYMSGFGRWKFGLELMYITSDLARDLQGSVVEYWVGASYNF